MKASLKLLALGVGAQLVASVLMGAPAQPVLRTYAQAVEITYASESEAAKAAVSFAPVYDAREWAFSARWDDCNPNSLQMRQHMAKFGLKGNFYLTQNDKNNSFGPEFCQQLMQDGCAIGAHSMSHPKLPELQAGVIWWQLMANRVMREDDTETTINSLAFPYGQFRNKDKPEVFAVISEAVRRAGFHHCVYADFVKNNPNLAPGEFSTGCQIVPGDRAVDAKAFEAQLAKPLKDPKAYREWTHCLSLGVHPWQTGEEWKKLDAIYQTLSGKSEWWYCSLTEWAAYARQTSRSEVKAEAGAAGAVRRYQITRPAPGELGAAVPLTCVIAKANVKSVQANGQSVPLAKRGETVYFNLPHGPGESLPVRIGHIEVPATMQTMGEALQCKDFPGLKGLLVAVPAQQKVKLVLAAPAKEELREVYVRFRLPLQYEPGIIVQSIPSLKAGAEQTIAVPLPAAKSEPYWSQGQQYWVAEVDFKTAKAAGRLFVTKLITH